MLSRYVVRPFVQLVTFLSVEIFRAVIFYFIVLKIQESQKSGHGIGQFREEF